MKGIPNKIYLQVDPENEKPETFNEMDGITWCTHRINKTDIPYFRKKKLKRVRKLHAAKVGESPERKDEPKCNS